MRTFLMLAIVLITAFSSTKAAVPQLINYQGVLTDSTGAGLDTTVNITFSIYDAAVGGTLIWTEPIPTVTVTAGLFNVLLGSILPLDVSIFSGSIRYLGITVGIDPEQMPRTQLVSVPYSYRVSTVDGASGGNITSKVSIGPGHILTGDSAAIGGGHTNTASGQESTVSGGHGNFATDHDATVGGGFGNIASGQASTIGGGIQNTANLVYATVAGGRNNQANGVAASVGGGSYDTANGFHATICGGGFNMTSQEYATIGGGVGNLASGISSTISGGDGNFASGNSSAIPGGFRNSSQGNQSFAAGSHAKANHSGAVVIAANSSISGFDSCASGGDEQLVLRADGGIYLTNAASTAPYTSGRLINTVGGAYLSGNGTTWTNASDKNQKENFTDIDSEELLDKISELPIQRWNYKDEDETVTHIDPVAQDFYALFGVGSDDVSISTIDPAGIALAAIQELYKKSKRVDALEQNKNELNQRLEKLEKMIDELSKK